MTEQISPELFNHLVDLAALELDEEEANYLRTELNHQLQAIDELQSIPLDPATPPAAHGLKFTTENSAPPRLDHWKPAQNPEEILAQAPEVENGYIVVPEIPHTELD